MSTMALASAGIAYSIRANTAADLQRVFLDPIDRAHSAEMIATILGVPFLAFAITIAIGSPLLDVIGMRVLLPLSPILLSVGMLMMAFAGNFVSGPKSTGRCGPERVGRRHRLGTGGDRDESADRVALSRQQNREAECRARVVAGRSRRSADCWAWGLSQVDLGWQAKLTVVLLPAIVCVILTMGVKFPPTERKAAGVSAGDMFSELLNPLFFVLFCSMFLTAASELAPGQWVDLALTRTVQMQGILLLVYVNGLMFVMRHFAGPLVHKLSPIGVLWCSCLGASLGLLRSASRIRR